MSRSAREYLQHILDEADYLLRESAGLDREAFLRDETRRRAFARSLEIIGEAAKQVPSSTRELFSSVEWKAMAGMRDRLVHSYFGVDYELVWDVVASKIPLLRKEVAAILAAPDDPRV
jgi:uncharacterized protein with HEPN domain